MEIDANQKDAGTVDGALRHIFFLSNTTPAAEIDLRYMFDRNISLFCKAYGMWAFLTHGETAPPSLCYYDKFGCSRSLAGGGAKLDDAVTL